MKVIIDTDKRTSTYVSKAVVTVGDYHLAGSLFDDCFLKIFQLQAKAENVKSGKSKSIPTNS